MSLFSKLFDQNDPKEALIPLYQQIVAHGRDPQWYIEYGVQDTQDGRFDMIVVILCLILIKIEQDDTNAQKSAYLTEVFVDDMDAQMRELGMGDVVVGKHVGNMVGALGGRLSAYRDAIVKRELKDALVRNLYRTNAPSDVQLSQLQDNLLAMHDHIQALDNEILISGHAAW